MKGNGKHFQSMALGKIFIQRMQQVQHQRNIHSQTAILHLHLLSMDDRRHHLPGAPYPCCGLPPPPPPKPPDGGGGGPPPPGGAACGASAAISSLREYRPSAREQSTLNHLKRFPFQSKKLRKIPIKHASAAYNFDLPGVTSHR